VSAAAAALRQEFSKVPAFLRRDLLVAWSYRLAFFGEWFALLTNALLFFLIGKLVSPDQLPAYGGTPTTYMEFVVIGLAVTMFTGVALMRVAAGIRNEQLAGTLEALLMTPASPSTIQFGTAAYELLLVPIRTAVFLLLVAVAFGIHLDTGGIVPAAALLLLFIPFMWGLGLINAATTLTFRRGASGAGFVAIMLGISSGAYFPLDVLPGWAASAAAFNPMAITVEGMREALLAGSGWSDLASGMLTLVPMSAALLAVGLVAFRLALRRERARGTLGLY
jgi:ABC-2 type transport system permease protein